MTKLIGMTSNVVTYKDEKGQLLDVLVTQVAYDNGSVHRQFGDGENWVEVKEADEMAMIVGACKYCQKPIFEDDEWFESAQQRTKWHYFSEDCESAENIHKIKKSDCHGNCGTCGKIILPKQEYTTNEKMQICHDSAKDCGQ
jgi:hypothetical protein